MYGEDMDWCLRFSRRGWPVVFNPVCHDHALRRCQLLQATDPLLRRNAAGGSPVLAHASPTTGLHHLLRCGFTGTCLSGCRSLCALARPAFESRAVRGQGGRQCCLFGALADAAIDSGLTSPKIRPTERTHTGMMEAEPHYGLVTAFRNERNWLADLVRSIEAQSIKPTTWVLVDDGSTDDSLDYARSLTRHLPFVEIVALVDTGTRNFASQVYAQLAGVERLAARMPAYLGFLDADIVVPPDYYETMLERFRSDPRLGIAGGHLLDKIGGSLVDARAGSTTTTFPEESSYSEPSATNKLEGTYQSRVGGRTSWSRRPP